MTRFIDELKRTHTCGELRLTDADSEAVLMGWVQRQHDRGGGIFVDLRDRDGLTQVTFDKQVSAEAFETASKLRSEYVIAVRGKVRDRGEQRNDKVPTGAVEVLGTELVVSATDEMTSVRVTRGVVAVRDRGGARAEVRAGEEGILRPSAPPSVAPGSSCSVEKSMAASSHRPAATNRPARTTGIRDSAPVASTAPKMMTKKAARELAVPVAVPRRAFETVFPSTSL